MFLKSLTKNPILMIGILLMTIFLLKYGKKFFQSHEDRFDVTVCRQGLKRFEKSLANNWQASCHKNTLLVEIDWTKLKSEKIFEKGSQTLSNDYKAMAYRQMANDFTTIANSDKAYFIENLTHITIDSKYSHLRIKGTTSGSKLIRLRTLTDKKIIAEHFKSTVKVQEIPLN